MNSLDPVLVRYIAAVRAVPPLTREAEQALATRYRKHGDARAAATILRANLREVIPPALRLRHYGIAIEELIAQGNLALVTALGRFEPERGLRFATYAKHWIRPEMLALTLRCRSMVGGGRGELRGRYVFGLRRAHAALSGQLGDPERVIAALAQRFSRSDEQIRSIVARVEARDASLDAQRDDSGTSPLVESLACDARWSPEEMFHRCRTEHRLRLEVSRAIADLSQRERFIYETRLIADDEERLTLAAIGKTLSISRERARQLEVQVKAKLRKRLSPLAQLALEPAA